MVMKNNIKTMRRNLLEKLLDRNIEPEDANPIVDGVFDGFERNHREKERFLRNMPEATLQHLRDKVRAYEEHMKEIIGDAK